MSPPEVVFVEEDHRYYVDDKEVPGISYILSSNGFSRYGKVNQEVMEAARARGTAVDTVINFFNEDFPLIAKWHGDLYSWEADSLSEPMQDFTKARLSGWIRFRQEMKYDVYFVQKRMSHNYNGMLYAFTLDTYGKMGDREAVVEVKNTAECEPGHQLQTLAQSLPFKEAKPLRYAVYARDEDYKPVEHKDRMDEKIFGCILAASWWKWERGIR